MEEDQLAALARRLRTLRLDNGLTQEQLSYRSGVSSDQISRIELQKHDPQFTTLAALAKGLGVKMSELMKGV